MMNCIQWHALLDAHLAGSLTPAQQKDFEAHLNACDDCQHLYTVRMDCRMLDDAAEVPALFASSWRQQVKREEEIMQEPNQLPVRRRKFLNRPWLRVASIAAALLVVVGGSLTLGRQLGMRQRATDASYDYAAGYSMPYQERAGTLGLNSKQAMAPAEMEMAADRSVPQSVAREEADATPRAATRIIRTASLTLSTRSFDTDLAALETKLLALGGYVENIDLSTQTRARRNADMRLRVPVDALDAFLEQLKGMGQLLSYNESAQDVSEQYADLETRLQTQQSKMQRLQALLEKAGSVKDLLEIENEVANTQYELDSLTGALRGYDSKINYATLWLTLQEETVPEAQGQPALGARIRAALEDVWAATKAFCEDAAVLVVVLLPFAAALALVVFIIRIFIKKHGRKNK